MHSIERSTDAAFLNRVVNDPSVFEAVALGGKEPINLEAAVLDEGNVFLRNEHGGFLFMNLGDGIYDVHTQFLPDGRGLAALISAGDAARYMFVETDCLAIRTFVAHSNKAAKRLTKWMKFEPIDTATLMGVPGVVYLLTLKRWAQEFQVCQLQQ
jgi:hypothetical protein